MEVGKILPVEAAAILHASPQFVRVAMQQETARQQSGPSVTGIVSSS